MSLQISAGLDARGYAALRQRWQLLYEAVALLAVDDEGRPVHGEPPEGCTPEVCRHAVAEALRFGECVVVGAGPGFIWAAPVLCNTRLLGGLVAQVSEASLFPAGGNRPRFDVRSAAVELMRLAEEADLANPPLMQARREAHRREAERGDFLRRLKQAGVDGLAVAWIEAEGALVAAVRSGDRAQARSIINRILVGVYHQTGEDLEVAKRLLLELVVMMCRSAVEAGSDRETLPRIDALGSELAAVVDDVALTRWLKRTLEAVFDALEVRRSAGPDEALRRALRWINANCDQELSRDLVARAVGLSPARLTRILHQGTGRGFNDLVGRARCDRARRLLERGGQGLLDIALEVGFKDASYFTKVFRRHVGMLPKEYRERMGG